MTIFPVKSFGEAIRGINDSDYGLQAGVFTNSLEKALTAYENIEVGGVVINDVPTYRIDHMPYGGVKASGLGREGLKYAIEDMTEPRLMIFNRLESEAVHPRLSESQVIVAMWPPRFDPAATPRPEATPA